MKLYQGELLERQRLPRRRRRSSPDITPIEVPIHPRQLEDMRAIKLAVCLGIIGVTVGVIFGLVTGARF